jgi:tetratricopeptide (TPR) repeat protein
MPAMRILAISLSIGLSVLLPAAAHAVDQADVDRAKQQASSRAENVVGPLAPQSQQLDSLYDRLKHERSPEKARALADRIREAYTQSGSATVDMLMGNSSKALNDKRYGAALDFSDQVTILDPTYAEGWNRRATIHYLMGNYAKSLSDVARTLALAPRHLGALSGLASILEDSGRDAQALKAWETYLSYYPADRDAQKAALTLSDKLSGQKT